MTNFSGENLNAACGGPQGGGMDSRRNGVAEESPKYLADIATNGVPVGYKQTEVGVIPGDWEVVEFGSALKEFRNGYAFSASGYASTGTPIITMAQIGLSGSFQFDISKVNKWDSEQQDSLKEFWVRDGDLLIAMTDVTPDKNLIGQMAIAKLDGIALLNQRVGLLRLKNEIAYSGYFSFLSCLPVWKTYCKGVASLGVQANIGTSDIRKAKVPLPTVKEQTAIANALSDVDALISELEKLIAKKQAIKTATMQQLLTGRTRLPQFALRDDGTPKGTKPSELGEIPEDWEVGFVGDVCDLLTGFPFPSSKYSDSGVRLLRGSNVKRSCTDWSEEITQYWPELTSSIAQYELKIGDIVISMDGSLVGRSFAQLRESDLPAVLLQRVARLRSEAVSQSYLKEWVCSKFFTEHCDSVKTVTAIPHISPQDIRSFKLLLPPSKEEQTAIAIILSDMDAEIQALEQRLGKTRQIKQGMMQELLTGKTRLIKPSKEVIHE